METDTGTSSVKERWQCRWAPSLGGLESTHQETWGTDDYTDKERPTVFFGLYGLPDFYELWRHKGERHILWAGSDITHFVNGYWLDSEGTIKLCPKGVAKWIQQNCTSWTENEVESRALKTLGIEANVCQSFLGDINSYHLEFLKTDKPKVYASVSGDNFKMYGWDLIEEIADRANVTFYLYGNTQEWVTTQNNVFVKGRIEKEQMNKEVMHMHSGLRLTRDMDGFSEITAKSILWGQHPIVYKAYGYPYLDSFSTKEELIGLLKNLKHKERPNYDAYQYYKTHINKFPWNQK
jgi:hypothetical protein